VELIFKSRNSITKQNCVSLGLKEYEEKFYKKLIRLGRGAYGEVWQCLELREDRAIVAMKFIKIEGYEQKKMIDNASSFLVEKTILEKLTANKTLNVAKLIGTFYTWDENSGNLKELILVTENGD
jgi:hypothetical protein